MGNGKELEIKQHDNSGSFEIEEQVSTRAIEALMSNYRDAQQAFLELIDNADPPAVN